MRKYLSLTLLMAFGGSSLWAAPAPASPSQNSAPVKVNIVANQDLGTIPDAVYGQFVEAVGYSVNGPIGLWSEILLDRKFQNDLTNPALLVSGGWAREWFHYSGMVRTDRVPAHSGQWCLELLHGADGMRGWNALTLKPATGKTTLTIEGWCMRDQESDANVQLSLNVVDPEKRSLPLGKVLEPSAEAGRWHAFRQTIELPESVKSVNLVLSYQNGPSQKGSVFLDDVKVSVDKGQKVLANGGFETNDTRQFVSWLPSGKVAMVRGKQAFVGTQSVQLADGASIQQGSIVLRENMDYPGRIVLQGTPGASCEVVLEGPDGFREVRQFSDLKETWEKRSLSFHSKKKLSGVTYRINARGGDVMVGAVSLMPADNIAGFRRDIVEKMKELKAPNYRWPGGCFVGAWKWKDQLGDPDKRNPRNAEEPNDAGLHEFMALCKELQTDPLICVNTGRFGEHGTPEYNKDLVLYCNSTGTPMAELRAKNGHPAPFNVKVWAIGNEMFGKWQYGHYDSVEAYAAKHNETVAAMRQADPSIKVVAVGYVGQNTQGESNETLTLGPTSTNWNKTMFELCADNIDYISEHFYSTATSLKGKDLFGHMTDLRDNLQSCFDLYRRSYKETGVFKPIMFDEWNYWYGPDVYGKLGPAMFHKDGIGVAAALHAILRNNDIIGGCNFAQTVNVLGAICSNRIDSAFSAVGLPLVLHRNHFGKHLVAVENADPKLEAVAAWAEDRKSLTISLINFNAEPKEVSLALEGCRPVRGETSVYSIQNASPEAQNVPGQTPQLSIEHTKASGTDIQLKPYSINVLVVPATKTN